MAGHAAGRRTVPSAAVLGPAGRDRAVPRHRERGPVAPVVGRRAVPERDAHHLARGLAGRHRGGRLRDRARPAHRAADPQRRPHGAVRSTGVGARSHHPVHVRHTVQLGVFCPPDCHACIHRFENHSIFSCHSPALGSETYICITHYLPQYISTVFLKVDLLEYEARGSTIFLSLNRNVRSRS